MGWAIRHTRKPFFLHGFMVQRARCSQTVDRIPTPHLRPMKSHRVELGRLSRSLARERCRRGLFGGSIYAGRGQPPLLAKTGKGGLYDCGSNAVYPQRESPPPPGATQGMVHVCKAVILGRMVRAAASFTDMYHALRGTWRQWRLPLRGHGITPAII